MSIFSKLKGRFLSLLGATAMAAVTTLASCSSQNLTTLYQAQCGGKNLLFQKVEKKTFEMTYHSSQIIFDGKAPLVLNNETISQSLPYRPDIYGKTPFHLLDAKPQTYNLQGVTYTKMRLVIYVNPALYSIAEFEELTQCLKTHAAAIAKAVSADKDLPKYQLAGLVYGKETDFVERFSKNSDDYYEVHPDGSVVRTQLNYQGIKGMKSESMGGLSDVEAGNIIRLTDAKEISIAALQNFKNQDGKSLPQRFKVLPK